MIYITARKNGWSTSLSHQANLNSDTQLVFRFGDNIDIDDITELTYQLGQRQYNNIQKTIGNGITRVDGTYVVQLDQADLHTRGLFKQYLQVTDSTGTYTATINVGRLDLQ